MALAGQPIQIPNHEKYPDLKVKHVKYSGSSGDQRPLKAENIDDVSVEVFLQKDILVDGGVHVVFMPRIENALEEAKDLCSRISARFCIPKFFWDEPGWNANGFFGSVQNPHEELDGSYATFMRFLSKKVEVSYPAKDQIATVVPDTLNQRDSNRKLTASDGKKMTAQQDTTASVEVNYNLPSSIEGMWHFMGFSTYFVPEVGNVKGTHVLLCFDLDPDVQEQFLSILQAANFSAYQRDPYMLINIVGRAVVERFDMDSWTFKKPIRDYEKHRIKHNYTKIEPLIQRYSDMHELSRHVIHISETLKVASDNLTALMEDYQLYCSQDERRMADLGSQQLLRYLRLSSNRLSNLEKRAGAFVHRLQNEIQLAFNIVAAVDSSTSKGILDQTRDDGKSFADTIAIFTLIFLPGTFVSGFFGMNFFALSTDDTGTHWLWQERLWLFFACTVPITLICFVIFLMDLPVIKLIRLHVSQPFKDYVGMKYDSSVERRHAKKAEKEVSVLEQSNAQRTSQAPTKAMDQSQTPLTKVPTNGEGSSREKRSSFRLDRSDSSEESQINVSRERRSLSRKIEDEEQQKSLA